MTNENASPAPHDVLEDWLTIWQSELAGLIVDREAQAAVLRFGAAWAAMVRAGVAAAAGPARGPAHGPTHGPGPGPGQEPRLEPAAGHAGADAAAGPTAVADASGHAAGRDAVIEQLLARVAELERRSGEPR